MIEGNRVAVVMPAYNAEKTVEKTAREVPDSVDIKILVDDHSSDDTVRVATQCGLKVFVHERITAMAEIRRLAIAKRWRVARTSSSWCTRTTNTNRRS
jgi:glycosyltransferase involved in cell wall biosynthesis